MAQGSGIQQDRIKLPVSVARYIPGTGLKRIEANSPLGSGEPGAYFQNRGSCNLARLGYEQSAVINRQHHLQENVSHGQVAAGKAALSQQCKPCDPEKRIGASFAKNRCCCHPSKSGAGNMGNVVHPMRCHKAFTAHIFQPHHD